MLAASVSCAAPFWQVAAQRLPATSLSRAWLYLSRAPLWLTGSVVSQVSSSNGLFLKAASASLKWQRSTPAASFATFFPIVSSHFELAALVGTLPESSPPKASVVVVVVVVVATVVVVVGAVQGPNVPVTSAPLGGPLFVGVGQAREKS